MKKKNPHYICMIVISVIATSCASREDRAPLVFDWNSSDCARHPYESICPEDTYTPKAPPRHINLDLIRPAQKKEYFHIPEKTAEPEKGRDEKPRRKPSGYQEGQTAIVSR